MSNAAWLAAIGCLVAAGAAHGQTVRGRVLVEGEDRQVAQAHIAVLAADRDAVVAARLSGDGTFLFDLADAGSYRLRVTALGYATLTTEAVAVEAGMSVTVELRLRPDAIALEPLRVVAERIEPPFMRDVRRRQQMGFGRLLTREELDGRFGSRLDDVLRDAGMWIEYVPLGQLLVPLVTGRQSVRSAIAGDACYSALYLNGVRQFPTLRGSGRDTVALEQAFDFFQFRPQDIEAIEIYRSRVQAPAEWADPMSECGVVAVWLRGGYYEPGTEDAPYTGPWPVVSLNVAGSSYRLTGGQAPDAGTALEAATYWRLSARLSAGVRLRRSMHVLPAETTEELMSGMNPSRFDVAPGPRSMSLFVMAAEPRLVLLPQARLTPAVSLRLQVARRSFAVDDPYIAARSYRFASLGVGAGAAAGLGLRVSDGIALEASAAFDRLFFGSYPDLAAPSKRTSATWSATSVRLGVTTRL